MTVNGDIINSGLIEALSGDGVGAIYFEGGGTSVNKIVNSGSLVVAAGAFSSFDNKSYLADPEHSTIRINSGDSVQTINNSGSIINTGFNSNSGAYAISVSDGGSLGSVINSGLIEGRVDFGANGGTYRLENGLQRGAIENADEIYVALANNGFLANLSTFGAPSGPVSSSDVISNLSIIDTYNGNTLGSFSHSGRLSFDVVGNPDGTISNSYLSIFANANLTGSEIYFNVIGDEFIAKNTEFSFLDAETLTGTPVKAVDNSAAFDFAIDQRTETDEFGVSFDVLFATAVLADIQTILEDIGIDATETGSQNTVEVFEAVFGGLSDAISNGDIAEDSELGLLVAELGAIDDNDELVEALETLEPEAVEGGAVGAMSADSAAASTVNNRQASLRGAYGISGAVAGDKMSINGFWMQAYDNQTESDDRDGIEGFDADTTGIALGADAPLGENMNVGVALSYADTDVEMTGTNEMSVDSIRLAIYGSYNAESYYLDGQIGYAYNDYDSTRVLFNGDVVKGDHSGDQYTARIRGGYPIALESGLYVTPIASADYTLLSEDKYSEKGTGSLEMKMKDVEALILSVGVKLAFPITTANEITWVPELSLEAMHDMIGDEIEIDSNFVGVSGAAFITNGADNEQEMYKASLRVRAFGQGNLSFSAGFDYVEKQHYKSESVMATVRYDF